MKDTTAAMRADHEATKHDISRFVPQPLFRGWDWQLAPFRRGFGAPWRAER